METLNTENITNSPNLFEIEAGYEESGFHSWIDENWAIGYAASVIYAITIFSLKQYMENRPKFELRYALAAWSGALAIFSIMGTIRAGPLFVQDIYDHGFQYSICDNGFHFKKPTNFWCYLFTMSKILELGDTIFIVLRKQPLIFLHYYHHVTVLMYVIHTYPQRTGSARWFMLMNFLMHSIMYTYYTLRAMRFKVPRFVNKVITTLLKHKVMVGLIINVFLAQMLMSGSPCETNWECIRNSTTMYVSYFVLFAKFFCDAYMKPASSKKEDNVAISNGQTSKKLQ